jgi:hypothetical protein
MTSTHLDVTMSARLGVKMSTAVARRDLPIFCQQRMRPAPFLPNDTNFGGSQKIA